jgi:hypothetical protein
VSIRLRDDVRFSGPGTMMPFGEIEEIVLALRH